jgi:hypothetical protein
MTQAEEGSELYVQMRETIRAEQERAGKRRPQTILTPPAAAEPRRPSRLKQLVQRLRDR